jgi:hypothetical protein
MKFDGRVDEKLCKFPFLGFGNFLSNMSESVITIDLCCKLPIIEHLITTSEIVPNRRQYSPSLTPG